MQMQKFTPEQVAFITMRMTGGKAKPEIVAAGYLKSANDMREYAAKASASKSGKYRGYTRERALELAKDCDERAISVPSEIRKIMGL